jgi:predicted transcriptional regulator
MLPLSSFDTASGRRDGRRSECKECRRARRGPRGKEGQQARALERELWVIREAYGALPALAEILSRALDEVRQVGATGAKLDEQTAAVRRAVLIHGCRSAEEVVEETRLSRKAVDRALDKLVGDNVLETRDRFYLTEEAGERGRPVTEYHPTDTPRGEVFTHILRRAVDDDLL